MKADSRIIQSPKFMYPFNGDGIFIIIVATQTKAANNEDTTIFCAVVFIVFLQILSADPPKCHRYARYQWIDEWC